MRSQRFPESLLAHRYLDGLTGIEIGESAHNAFGLDTRNVDYTGCADTSFKRAEVEMCGATAKVDIEAPGDRLPLADKSVDFVISSHVIEHFFDPIKALKEWRRVARRWIYIICPQPEAHPDDRGKPLTTLEELRRRHAGELLPEGPLNPDEHQSRWNSATFAELCRWLGMKVAEVQDPDDKVGNGFAVVIDLSETAPLVDEPAAGSFQRQRSGMVLPTGMNNKSNTSMSAEHPMAFYHICAMNHWREVVNEQAGLLARTGFKGLVQISFIGGPFEDGFVHAVMKRHGLSYTVASVTGEFEEFEFPALRLLKSVCDQGFDGTVMYFHTKSVSQPGSWERMMWRWLMNGWVIGHWQKLQAALRGGEYNVAGTGWVPHLFPTGAFAGTFWHARADYIRSLTGFDDYVNQFVECLRHSNPHGNTMRHAAEFWINSRCSARPAVFGPGDSRLWDHAWWMENPEHRHFAERYGS